MNQHSTKGGREKRGHRSTVERQLSGRGESKRTSEEPVDSHLPTSDHGNRRDWLGCQSLHIHPFLPLITHKAVLLLCLSPLAMYIMNCIFPRITEVPGYERSTRLTLVRSPPSFTVKFCTCCTCHKPTSAATVDSIDGGNGPYTS